MTEFITSDWHFGHNNIAGENSFVSTRKHFKDATDMDTSIIKAINSVVTNADTIYHLGDIGMNLNNQATLDILVQIKGQIHLVQGNHDGSGLLKFLVNRKLQLPDGRDKFVVHDLGLRKKKDGMIFYLTHYPLGLGEMRKNMRNICGHIHDETAYDPNVLNAGIDSPEISVSVFGQPIKLDDAMDLVNIKWKTWYNSRLKINV